MLIYLTVLSFFSFHSPIFSFLFPSPSFFPLPLSPSISSTPFPSLPSLRSFSSTSFASPPLRSLHLGFFELRSLRTKASFQPTEECPPRRLRRRKQRHSFCLSLRPPSDTVLPGRIFWTGNFLPNLARTRQPCTLRGRGGLGCLLLFAFLSLPVCFLLFSPATSSSSFFISPTPPAHPRFLLLDDPIVHFLLPFCFVFPSYSNSTSFVLLRVATVTRFRRERKIVCFDKWQTTIQLHLEPGIAEMRIIIHVLLYGLLFLTQQHEQTVNCSFFSFLPLPPSLLFFLLPTFSFLNSHVFYAYLIFYFM